MIVLYILFTSLLCHARLSVSKRRGAPIVGGILYVSLLLLVFTLSIQICYAVFFY